MSMLLIAVALTWPADCMTVGEHYHRVALLRDTCVKIEDALLRERPMYHAAIAHVYERRDMTPEQWRYMAIGVCVAARNTESRERGLTCI